jgi:hypothetical protein
LLSVVMRPLSYRNDTQSDDVRHLASISVVTAKNARKNSGIRGKAPKSGTTRETRAKLGENGAESQLSATVDAAT